MTQIDRHYSATLPNSELHKIAEKYEIPLEKLEKIIDELAERVYEHHEET
jgi:DNA-binding IscR family transcriptional regulator